MSAKEDKKKMIGEYLKAADRSIQASEFTQAMIEVKKALDLEPGNMYALAYNQRIKAALESQRKKEDVARVTKKMSDTAKSASAASSARKEPTPTEVPEAGAWPDAATTDAPASVAAKPQASAPQSPAPQSPAPQSPAPQPSEPQSPAPQTPAPTVPVQKQPASSSKEDDRYLIGQQQTQIERFKEEIESLRLKRQQEIALLGEELREAREGRTAVEGKHQALTAGAEQSRRRIEELQAEIKRLQEESRRRTEELQAKTEELRRRTEELQAEAKRLKEESQTEVKKLQEKSQAEVHRLKEESQAEVKRLKEESLAEVRRLREESRLREEAETEVKRLQAEVARLQDRPQAAEPSAIDTVTSESLLREVVSFLLLADTLSAEANDVMELIRTRLGFDDDAFVKLQTAVKFDLYRTALKKAWTEGYITPEQADRLADLRKKIGVSAEDHFTLEAELRGAKKKR